MKEKFYIVVLKERSEELTKLIERCKEILNDENTLKLISFIEEQIKNKLKESIINILI